MKINRKIAIYALLLSVVLMLTSCTAQREDNGVAYEKNMKIETMADLEGKQVAVQLRSPVDAIFTESKVTKYLRRYENMERAAQDVLDKKMAALIVDSNYAQYLVANVTSKDAMLKVLNIEVGTVDYKFAALKNESNEKMITAFDQRIAAMKGTERLNEIISANITSCKDISVEKVGDELANNVTLLADPYFMPYVYKDDKNMIKGFFTTVADECAYAYGANLAVETAAPGMALEALSDEDPQFAVVSGDIDPEKYTETSPFYTAKLVILVRSEEK